jgi:hypothetical protein
MRRVPGRLGLADRLWASRLGQRTLYARLTSEHRCTNRTLPGFVALARAHQRRFERQQQHPTANTSKVSPAQKKQLSGLRTCIGTILHTRHSLGSVHYGIPEMTIRQSEYAFCDQFIVLDGVSDVVHILGVEASHAHTTVRHKVDVILLGEDLDLVCYRDVRTLRREPTTHVAGR